MQWSTNVLWQTAWRTAELPQGAENTRRFQLNLYPLARNVTAWFKHIARHIMTSFIHTAWRIMTSPLLWRQQCATAAWPLPWCKVNCTCHLVNSFRLFARNTWGERNTECYLLCMESQDFQDFHGTQNWPLHTNHPPPALPTPGAHTVVKNAGVWPIILKQR